MGGKTPIEWTDATWNAVTGCTKLSPSSPGCANCYASTFAERWRGTPGHYFEKGFDVQLRPDKLDLPLRWKRPRRIFVNSMSDLFHDQVPDDYIARVWAVMAVAEQHTFQVLTKRHGRMRSLLSSEEFQSEVAFNILALLIPGDDAHPFGELPSQIADVIDWWPLRNIWLGVSAENQQWADIRIPTLLDIPAAVRFVSAEPLLGPINFTHMDVELHARGMYQINALTGRNTDMARPCPDVAHLDWVITGGESGPGARPAHPGWFRSIRDQCQTAGIAYLHKQNGEFVEAVDPQPTDRWLTGEGTTHDERWNPDQAGAPAGKWSPHPDVVMRRVGKKAAGRLLDGRTHDDYPQAVTHA